MEIRGRIGLQNVQKRLPSQHSSQLQNQKQRSSRQQPSQLRFCQPETSPQLPQRSHEDASI